MIIGVRHASVENPGRVVYARLPGFHLSADGRAEAERAASALSTAPVVAVHSSPLERAIETAEILAKDHGLAVRTDERLLEWSFWSHWEGLPWENIRDRDPELLETYGDDPEQAWPQDPLEAAGRRVLSWAEEADGAHSEGIVLGVTHEAPLIAALLTGSGRDISVYRTVNLPHLGFVRILPGPAEIVDLTVWAGSW